MFSFPALFSVKNTASGYSESPREICHTDEISSFLKIYFELYVYVQQMSREAEILDKRLQM